MADTQSHHDELTHSLDQSVPTGPNVPTDMPAGSKLVLGDPPHCEEQPALQCAQSPQCLASCDANGACEVSPVNVPSEGTSPDVDEPEDHCAMPDLFPIPADICDTGASASPLESSEMIGSEDVWALGDLDALPDLPCLPQVIDDELVSDSLLDVAEPSWFGPNREETVDAPLPDLAPVALTPAGPSPLRDDSPTIDNLLLTGDIPRPGWHHYRIDWRWRLAQCIAAGARRPPRLQHDSALEAAVTHIMSGHTDHSDSEKLLPGFADAVQLSMSGGLRRSEVEARVLAREHPTVIATHVGLPVDVISAYMDLFFDIRDRLDCLSIVMFHVFGASIYQEGVKESDTSTLMKLLAYNGGPYVLADYLWFLATPAPTIPRRLQDLSDADLGQIYLWVLIRSLVLSLTVRCETDEDRIRYLNVGVRAHLATRRRR